MLIFNKTFDVITMVIDCVPLWKITLKRFPSICINLRGTPNLSRWAKKSSETPACWLPRFWNAKQAALIVLTVPDSPLEGEAYLLLPSRLMPLSNFNMTLLDSSAKVIKWWTLQKKWPISLKLFLFSLDKSCQPSTTFGKTSARKSLGRLLNKPFVAHWSDIVFLWNLAKDHNFYSGPGWFHLT